MTEMKKTLLVAGRQWPVVGWLRGIVCVSLVFNFQLSIFNSLRAQESGSNQEYSLKIGGIKSAADDCKTLHVDFSLYKNGKKTFSNALLKDAKGHFDVTEEGMSPKYWPTVDTIIDLRASDQKTLSDSLSILLLIDKSATITDEMLLRQSNVVQDFQRKLPNTRIYISFMDNGTVTPTELLVANSLTTGGTRINFFIGEGRQGMGEKHLYRAILSKLQEMSGEGQSSCTYPDVSSNTDFLSGGGEKMLFVFTDGRTINRATGDHYGGDAKYYACFDELERREEEIAAGRLQNIPIHLVFVGNDESLDEQTTNKLISLCSTGNEDDIKGHFYKDITPDSLQSMMMRTLDSLAMDYRLVLTNPNGKMYDGSRITLNLCLKDAGAATDAVGKRYYSEGSLNEPKVVGGSGTAKNLILGLLVGLLTLVAVYGILQYLLPMISYKNFLKKYVHPYHAGAGDVVAQTCYYCKEPFAEGEEIVSKCEHVVHKSCWDENRNRCPEYGLHKCSKGIHYYNQEKKSDPQNATHFAPWILHGMAAGFLAWIGIILLQSTSIFGGLINALTDAIFPFAEDALDGQLHDETLAHLATKLRPILLQGIFLGFFITLAFSMVLEFRKRDVRVIVKQSLRAFVGALVGFVAFLLGGVILMACGAEYTCWYLDWIPWMLFALSVATVLWYKTEVKLKSALIGGAASVILCFIVMFVFTGPVTSLPGYMIYVAGFGMSIAVVHFSSEKYFLRIDGSIKERDVAIYKWMSVTGGFNKVSIGKSVDCVLQMNWDDSEGISDRAVELYLENDRPYCRILDQGVTRQGRTLPKGIVIPLVHGSEFSIGKTRFTYIEKDR